VGAVKRQVSSAQVDQSGSPTPDSPCRHACQRRHRHSGQQAPAHSQHQLGTTRGKGRKVPRADENTPDPDTRSSSTCIGLSRCVLRNRPYPEHVILCIGMVSRCFSVCALLAAWALLVAGCSSGGGTRTNVARNLGPCPSMHPTAPLTKFNAGVQGLGKTLVPIAAVRVRACEYDTTLGLGRTFTLSPPLAAQFEAETNHLPAGALGGIVRQTLRTPS